MGGRETRILALTMCAAPLFGSDVGAHPLDGSAARPVPVVAVEGWSPRGAGAFPRTGPVCLDGSRWYGPYGYICYRTRGRPPLLGLQAGPR